jgi:hypothetical protein
LYKKVRFGSFSRTFFEFKKKNQKFLTPIFVYCT